MQKNQIPQNGTKPKLITILTKDVFARRPVIRACLRGQDIQPQTDNNKAPLTALDQVKKI